MNNSNPLIPQGSLLEQAPRGRSKFMVAFYCVAAIHVVFFGGLLIVGCNNGDKAKTEPPADTNISTTDTNTGGVPALPPMIPATPGTSSPPAIAPYVPPAPPTPPPAPEPTAREYVVVKGDNMGNIAKSNHITLKALMAANPNVVPTKLNVGQKLQIPAGSATDAGSASLTPGGVAAMSAGGAETYTVKSGDTLTKIAKANGVTVKALKAANGLKTDGITVGKKLKLPAKAAAPVVEPAPMMTPPPAPSAPSMPASPGPITPAAPVR